MPYLCFSLFLLCAHTHTHTQVLIYSGQLDVIVAAPLTERFLPTVNWTGADEFNKASRFHWKIQPEDTEVAGYVRQVGEFYQVSTACLCPGAGFTKTLRSHFFLAAICFLN